MKKSLIILAFAAALTVSCKDAKEEPVTPGNIVPENEGELYDAEQAKAKFQDAAVAAMNIINPDDFKPILDLIDYIAGELKDSDLDEVGERLQDAIDEQGYSDSSSEELIRNGVRTREHLFKANWLFTLAPFTGKYTLKDGKWKIEDADNLVITVPDENGKDCVLTLNKSSKSTTIVFADIHDEHSEEHEEWIGWDPETYEDYYETVHDEYVDDEKIAFVLPEKIELTLVDNGQTMISADVTTKADINGVICSTFTPDNDVVGKAVLDMAYNIEIAGYTYSTERIKFDKNDMAVTMKIRKNNVDAITVTATSKDLSFSEETFTDSDDDITYTYVAADVAPIKLGVDVMGMLQISGEVDIVPMSEEFDNFYDAAREGKSEKECLKYVDNANQHIDLGLYFGSRTRQASLLFDGIIEKNSWSQYGEIIPVLKFEDKSRYAFDEYFNDTDFRRTMGVFEDLLDEFAKITPEFIFGTGDTNY